MCHPHAPVRVPGCGQSTYSPWPAAANPAPGHRLHDSVWGMAGGLVWGGGAALSSKCCGCSMYPDAAIVRGSCSGPSPVSNHTTQRLWLDSGWRALASCLEQEGEEMLGRSWEAGPPPQAGGQMLSTSLSLESAGRTGTSLRRLARWVASGVRWVLRAQAERPPTQRARGGPAVPRLFRVKPKGFVFTKSVNIKCSLKGQSCGLRSSLPRSQEGCEPAPPLAL